jgi:HPt (histidine-containing phosphotransfer) domain-containing protein
LYFQIPPIREECIRFQSYESVGGIERELCLRAQPCPNIFTGEIFRGNANMASALEDLKPLDCKKLLEECDDEPSLVSHCLHVFVRETQADLEGIAAALGRRDLSKVARLAHRIKGASATIRAEFLRKEAAQLDLLANRGMGAEAAECFASLRAEFDSFRKFIASLPQIPE